MKYGVQILRLTDGYACGVSWGKTIGYTSAFNWQQIRAGDSQTSCLKTIQAALISL
jgi:hypothetical protein